jgi:CRISPR-associated protein Cas1
MAAKMYFGGLFKLMGERHNFDVNDRNRRPPKDPVNAVLSFAYALLAKELTVVLQAVGFDPMLGVFHRPRYGRPSLALDLAEEYRPLIADSVMLTAFNNGELTSSHFLERAGAVTLTKSGRAALIATFERRMQTEVTHPIFGYKISYRRLLEVQSRLLSRAMLGEIAEYPAFCTR